MSQKHIIVPNLFLASLVSFGNILCPDFAEESKFRLPQRQVPERTTPGGSRSDGQCFLNAEKMPLTPLVPKDNFGLTVAKYPTIFVYIPETFAKKAFFSITDPYGKFHYQTEISLPEQSGAIAISLAQIQQPLQLNSNYQWSLVLICGDQLEPDDPQVTGFIQRVELDYSPTQLSELDISQQSVCLLSQQGIWYDLLHHLAELRKAQPENSFLIQHWEELLTKVGLEAFATEPLFH